MENNIRAVKELLDENPNKMFYKWLGTFYSTSDVLSRLDKTYMFCIYKDDDGEYRYNRIIGYPDITDNYDNIVYSTEVTPRITTGGRKGRIVPMDKLYPDENFSWSGIYKKLIISETESHGFSPSNRTDKILVDLLDDLLDMMPEDTGKITYPDIYICTSSSRIGHIRLRESGFATSWFRKKYGIEHIEEALTGNLPDDIIEDISVFAGRTKIGNTRLGMPFKYFRGKGVRAVDVDNAGKWLMADKPAHGEIINEVRFII